MPPTLFLKQVRLPVREKIQDKDQWTVLSELENLLERVCHFGFAQCSLITLIRQKHWIYYFWLYLMHSQRC